jgi:hypothetical protein
LPLLFYLLELDNVFVKDIASFRGEESDGRQQQHHVLVGPPLRVERLNKKAQEVALYKSDLAWFDKC